MIVARRGISLFVFNEGRFVYQTEEGTFGASMPISHDDFNIFLNLTAVEELI